MTRVLIAIDHTEESVHVADVAGRLFGNDADDSPVPVLVIAPTERHR